MALIKQKKSKKKKSKKSELFLNGLLASNLMGLNTVDLEKIANQAVNGKWSRPMTGDELDLQIRLFVKKNSKKCRNVI